MSGGPARRAKSCATPSGSTPLWRRQRQSDGTVSIEGRRFEVPSRFRAQRRLRVRYARWDLSRIDIVDPRTDVILAPLYPLDKAKNADRRRRTLQPLPDRIEPEPRRSGEPAPLLKKLMRDYAATGLPPAYLPLHQGGGDEDSVEDEAEIEGDELTDPEEA
jgi:putative transposase